MDFLRDAVWQSIGVFLSAIAILATFAVYWLQRQVKEVSFGVLSKRRLLSVADEVASRVQVHLDGRVVQNVSLWTFGIKNTGQKAVIPDDFLRPISIGFEDAELLSAEIAHQKPKNLGATVTSDGSLVTVQPLLLNPGDYLTVQVLLSGAAPDYRYDGRIVDVRRIELLHLASAYPPLHQSGAAVAIGGALVTALSSFVFSKSGSYLMWIGLAGLILGITIAIRTARMFSPRVRRTITEA